MTKVFLQSAHLAQVGAEYAKWWSTTDSGAIIHLDSNADGFSSLFWDENADHRAEDVADEVDNGDLNFIPFQDWCRP
jgi:hypothetical protein